VLSNWLTDKTSEVGTRDKPCSSRTENQGTEKSKDQSTVRFKEWSSVRASIPGRLIGEMECRFGQ